MSLKIESLVAIFCPTAFAIMLTQAKIIGSTDAGLRLQEKECKYAKFKCALSLLEYNSKLELPPGRNL